MISNCVPGGLSERAGEAASLVKKGYGWGWALGHCPCVVGPSWTELNPNTAAPLRAGESGIPEPKRLPFTNCNFLLQVIKVLCIHYKKIFKTQKKKTKRLARKRISGPFHIEVTASRTHDSLLCIWVPKLLVARGQLQTSGPLWGLRWLDSHLTSWLGETCPSYFQYLKLRDWFGPQEMVDPHLFDPCLSQVTHSLIVALR